MRKPCTYYGVNRQQANQMDQLNRTIGAIGFLGGLMAAGGLYLARRISSLEKEVEKLKKEKETET